MSDIVTSAVATTARDCAPAQGRNSKPGAGHVPALDGLRGLAIAAVVFYHAAFPGSAMGWLGVDLFFVLSGFLITTLLAGEHARDGRVDLPAFWRRRVARLMPAYWCFLGVMTAAMLLGVGGGLRESAGWSPASYVRSFWLYYCNYTPEGVWRLHSTIFHAWSLAVEEQFYLLWPIVLTACLAYRRPAAEAAAWGGILAIVVRNHIVFPPAHFSLETRGSALLIGCAMALRASASPRLAARVGGRGVAEAAALAVLAMTIAATVLMRRRQIDVRFAQNTLAPMFSVVFAVLCASFWYGSRGPAARFLSRARLGRLGKVSYGVYLYHMVPHYVFLKAVPTWLPGWHPRLVFFPAFAAYVVVSYVVASLSYRYVEAPFLRLKSRRPARAIAPVELEPAFRDYEPGLAS